MRKSIPISVVLLHLTLAMQSLHASEEALNAVPQPPDSERHVAVINLVQNGHRVSIANLKSQSSMDEILDFYRGAWVEPLADSVPGFIEDTAGDWTIISRPAEKWHQVVQLRQTDKGLSGRISVMEFAAASVASAPLPVPSDAALLSTTSATDIGTNATTYTVVSRGGVDSMIEFYRHHYQREGWTSVSRNDLGSTKIAVMHKGGERVEIVVTRSDDGNSVAIINQVADHG